MTNTQVRTMMSQSSTLPGAPVGDWRVPMLAGVAIIVGTFGIFGGWSATARLDSAVVSSGQIVVETERKLVQHLEGGIVSEILVKEDQRVTEGDVLVRIDPVQARANAAMANNQRLSAMAEEARIVAELGNQTEVTFPDELLKSTSPEAQRAVADQQRLFIERRDARRNDVAVLQERIGQAERQMDGLRAQVASSKQQSASYADEMDKVRPLVDRGLIAVPRIRQLERAKTDQDGKTGQLEAEIQRQERVIKEAQTQREGIYRKVAEENSGKLSQVRAAIADWGDKVTVAEDVLRRAELRAPRTGRIVNMKVHTVGAVVRPGETIMEIVPEDDVLLVSARMQPIDITHVHPGLAAEVRLPAFKSRTTPIAIGEVRSVSADVMRDDYTRQPYYELKVSVRASSFPAEIRDKLVPGMPAEAVVATGERTVLSYLTQPLTDALRRGMREH